MSTTTKREVTSGIKDAMSHKSQVIFFFVGIGVVGFAIRFAYEYILIREWMFKTFKEPEYGWPQF